MAIQQSPKASPTNAAVPQQPAATGTVAPPAEAPVARPTVTAPATSPAPAPATKAEEEKPAQPATVEKADEAKEQPTEKHEGAKEFVAAEAEAEGPPTKKQCLEGGVAAAAGMQAGEGRERQRRQPHGRSTEARPFQFRTQMRTGHRVGSVQSSLDKDLQECEKQFKSKGFSKGRVGKFGELGVKRTEAKKSTEFEEFSFMKREANKRSKSEVGQMSPSEMRRASIEARTLQAAVESPRSEHPLQKGQSAAGGMAFRATPKPAFRESRVFRPRCTHRKTVCHPFKLRIDDRMGKEEEGTPNKKHERQQVTSFRSTSLRTAPMVKGL